MASPNKLRELRVRFETAFLSNHKNAATSDWTSASSSKIRHTAYDVSGLKSDGFEDESLQTRMYAKPKVIPGLTKGDAKISTYLEGAYLNVANHPVAKMFEVAMGGLASPATRVVNAVLSGSTTAIIAMNEAGAPALAGQAVLVGTKGDGRGNGEVKPITGCSTTQCNVGVLTQAIVAEGDDLVFSTTAYLDEDATQKYLSVLGIGHATADQRQIAGAVCIPSLSGLDLMTAPKVDWAIKAADHRLVPANERATVSHAASDANDPAFGKAIGLIHIGDYGSTTRTAYKGTVTSFDPGVDFVEIPDPSGVNKIGGWQRVPKSPTMEVSILFDEDMPGLEADYLAGTAKSIIAQFGHSIGKCVAIELPKCYVDGSPVNGELGGLAAVTFKVHAEEAGSTNDLLYSACKIHCF